MGKKSKVLVMDSHYESCAEAVTLAFATFPQDISGKNVVVKVNGLKASNPECEAVVTHPVLLKAVIERLELMAPKQIIVGDSVGTESYGNSHYVFDRTGLAEAAGPYYRNLSKNLEIVTVERPFRRKVAVLKDVLDADVYISLPKLKTHGLTMLSGAVKNNFGLLPGAQKSWYHYYSETPERFAEILIEMYRLRPPDLVIMDGILAMEGYGPCSPETRRVNKVLAATDAVALDTILAGMVGFEVDEVPYLRIARELGLGETDPERIEVIGDASPVEGFHRPVVTPDSTYCYLSGIGGGKTSQAFFADRVSYRPEIAAEKCPAGCTACTDVCPSGALQPGQPPVLILSECMLCSACMESCTHGALKLVPEKTLRTELDVR